MRVVVCQCAGWDMDDPERGGKFWQDCGGITAGLQRDCCGSVAGLWRDGGGGLRKRSEAGSSCGGVAGLWRDCGWRMAERGVKCWRECGAVSHAERRVAVAQKVLRVDGRVVRGDLCRRVVGQ